MIDSSKRKGNYVLVLRNSFYLFSFKYFCLEEEQNVTYLN